MNKDDRLIIKILILLFYWCIYMMCTWMICGDYIAKGETVGCTVICEIPEDKIEYTIPKMKGQNMIFVGDKYER